MFDLGSTSWIRVRGRLIRVSDQLDQADMDSQVVTFDQFVAVMASIQEAITSLDQMMDGQQTQKVLVQESVQYDPTIPPPLPFGQIVSQPISFTLQSQTEVALLPVIVPTLILEDPHARMDRLERRIRQMKTSDEAITWEDFNGAPVASLSTKFRMSKIERYTDIGFPRIHLRLYSTVMRAHGLDEAQMVMFFPISLSGVA